MADTPVCVHIWVTGRVQGVGFRAFVAENARQIGLIGWVRNVSLDTVETLGVGSRAQVDHFIQVVKAGNDSSHVESCRVAEEPAIGEFNGFDIRSSR